MMRQLMKKASTPRLPVNAKPHLEALEERTLLSTCHVTRQSDANSGVGMRGTLRFCINKVNDLPGPDAIDFHFTGTIKLTIALPKVTSEVTITGPGADLLTVSGTGSLNGELFPVFFLDSASKVTISGLTIANGISSGSPGGIMNRGTLTLKDCTVANNENWLGDPTSSGGGIYNSGKMTISGCTISGNAVIFPNYYGEGGGIYNSGSMTIENSTISGNHVEGFFPAEGGGIYNRGSLEIRFSTVTSNDGCEGWGIFNKGSLNMSDTIVAGNIKGEGCSDGQDLEGSFLGSANLIGGDPKLAPLANNGGPTQTHAPLPGSPAIDAGDNADAPEFDQRGPGFPRIVNGTIDIGAYEVQATTIPAPPSLSPKYGADLLTLCLGTADLEALD